MAGTNPFGGPRRQVGTLKFPPQGADKSSKIIERSTFSVWTPDLPFVHLCLLGLVVSSSVLASAFLSPKNGVSILQWIDLIHLLIGIHSLAYFFKKKK